MTHVSTVSPLELLLNRASTDALSEPPPQGRVLEKILSAGLCAPDHGRLKPWRYIVIQGDNRTAFAETVVRAMERQEPTAPKAKKDKRQKRFMATPMIIALGMHLRVDHKVPLIEQEMSVAAGAMNVLNALHLEGFGGVWVSGPFCEDRILLEKLGLKTPHRLAGFLLVGTPSVEKKRPIRPVVQEYVKEWQDGVEITFEADRGQG